MNQSGMAVAARGLAGLLAIAAIGGGASYAGSVVRKNEMIETSTAEDFAILDAGVNAEEISGLWSKLVRKNGQYHYDIRFYAGGKEYEYEISARNGEVLEKNMEQEDGVTDAQSEAAVTDAQSEGTVTDSQAEETVADARSEGALADAQSEAAVTDPQSEEFVTDQQSEGASSRKEDGRPPEGNTAPGKEKAEAAPPAAGYISVDEAKEIALRDAGRREEEVRFSSAKLDDDDDGTVYEIEFYVENLEYDYEIDAVSGRIVESSVEEDDD